MTSTLFSKGVRGFSCPVTDIAAFRGEPRSLFVICVCIRRRNPVEDRVF